MVFLLFHDVYAGDARDSGFCSAAANRYKLTIEQFDRELHLLAAAQADALPFGLTFDDGGESFYTIVADRLEAFGWRGQCFVSTNYIGGPGFLTRRQIRELSDRGHGIGSHTASHPQRLHLHAPQTIAAEWHTSVAVLEDILGHAVTTASVPGGCYSTMVAEAADAAGIRTLFTSQPVQSLHRVGGCHVEGRFAIRHHSPPGLSARLVRPAPWSRWGMWTHWNAKAVVKPILGPFYMRVADWLMAGHSPEH